MGTHRQLIYRSHGKIIVQKHWLITWDKKNEVSWFNMTLAPCSCFHREMILQFLLTDPVLSSPFLISSVCPAVAISFLEVHYPDFLFRILFGYSMSPLYESQALRRPLPSSWTWRIGSGPGAVSRPDAGRYLCARVIVQIVHLSGQLLHEPAF